MEEIRSRQNKQIQHLIALETEKKLRREESCFVCAGQSMLEEAIREKADIQEVFYTEEIKGLSCRIVSEEILQYASPLKNSSAPVFVVKMREASLKKPEHAVVLENVQDPGNVGTVLRTADAFGIDLVVFCGECADIYNPKTIRGTMGAVFRQNFIFAAKEELGSILGGLPLYAAVPAEDARNIADIQGNYAVAIGNEGNGLSEEMISLCKGRIVIPMRGKAESLNAAVAASICMYEMIR